MRFTLLLTAYAAASDPDLCPAQHCQCERRGRASERHTPCAPMTGLRFETKSAHEIGPSKDIWTLSKSFLRPAGSEWYISTHSNCTSWYVLSCCRTGHVHMFVIVRCIDKINCIPVKLEYKTDQHDSIGMLGKSGDEASENVS